MLSVARALLLGGVTGKVLGIVRELLTAALFGTGPVAAAYRLAQAAFLIPLHGFLSDTFSAGFTPAYARALKQQRERGAVLFSAMHALVLGVSILVAVLMGALAMRWVRLLAPGFGPQTAALAAQMVVVLSVAMPFYALTGLYAAAELAAGRAHLAAARASAQSIGLIAGTLLTWWTGNALYIAAGFLCAYVALTLRGFAGARAEGLHAWPREGEWTEARTLLRPVGRSVRILLFIPLLLQIHFVIERRVASIVSPDAVAALDYVRFLSDTAVLLLAVPIGLAGLGTLPLVSEARFRELAAHSMRLLLYAGVPLSLVLVLHGDLVVKLVFGRGAFGAESIALTATLLQTLAIGLWAQLLGYAGARFLSARNRNLPLIGIYAAAVGCNVLLNLILYRFMGAAGVGLAAAANSLLSGALVIRSLGCFRDLRSDLVTLALLSLGYLLLWRFAPDGVSSLEALPLLAFACYWGAVALAVPRCRAVLHEVWLSMRTV